MLITGKNVEVENLTIRNDAGDGRDVGQAVAVYAAGDRCTFRNCRLIGSQDTLFCGPLMPKVEKDILPRKSTAECVESVGDSPLTHARQYFEDCYIQGDVDFIFGPYRVWFEKCTLFMNERGGLYTAANTPETQMYGFVFHRCRLTGACEAGQAFLGRPWRKFARTVFLECEMDEHVAPEGFHDWDEEKKITERCGEYGTYGARADQSTRHPAQKRLSPEEAMVLTIPEVIGGFDGWRPDRRTPTWFLCGDSTMANYAPDRAPMAGWGQMLGSLLSEHAFVENCAVNGRSSKSFVAEKRLNYIECCLRPGDRLIISFSHNDEKDDPTRYTSPHVTFPEYLNMYIDAARRQGATPILCTPIARRHFDQEGRLLKTHGAYPDAMRALAVYRGVQLVDLEKATMSDFQRLGPEGTKAFYCYVEKGHANYPEGCSDNSHLQLRGAARVADLFLRLMRGGQVDEMQGDFGSADGHLDDLIAREDHVVVR